MKIARTKNAVKNISVGIVLRLYQMIIPFLMRTAMIHFMGVQYLGLNSLFSSILHVLNLAEMGVGIAMVYSMYKPIAEDDHQAICALMGLYRKYYRIIGLVIGAAGLLLTPFVPRLISGEVPGELNIQTLYLMNLSVTVFSYWLFAYKNCLLQAHQRLDIANIIVIITYTAEYVLQLAVIIWLKNYYLYVLVKLATTIANNLITAAVVNRKFPQYKPAGSLPEDKVKVINQKVRDLFTGKLGSVVLSSADNLVISAFLGLSVLAVYQNYYFILGAVLAMVEMILGSITAGLGNSFVTETREKNFRDLQKFTFMFTWLTGVCTCCFLGMYQPFMEIWVGQELMLGYGEVICFALYFFELSLYRLLNIYKDAAGLWHIDRFRPLVSAMINLVLNLLTVRWLGLVGVILSTVVSQVFVGYPWLLRNLFTQFFKKEDLQVFLRKMLSSGAVVAVSAVMVGFICNYLPGNSWLRMICGALVALIVSNGLYFLVFRKDERFRQSVKFADRMTKKRLRLEARLFRG